MLTTMSEKREKERKKKNELEGGREADEVERHSSAADVAKQGLSTQAKLQFWTWWSVDASTDSGGGLSQSTNNVRRILGMYSITYVRICARNVSMRAGVSLVLEEAICVAQPSWQGRDLRAHRHWCCG